MNRRDAVLALLAISVGTMPLRVRAQAAPMRRIGLLLPGTLEAQKSAIDGFTKRLLQLGWVEGKNIAIEVRNAENHPERLTALAIELLEQKPALIVTRSTPAAVAMKKTGASVPVVFTAVADPVALGLVQSLARPGGNMTGMSSLIVDVTAKQFELLKELQPQLQRLAVLLAPGHPANKQLTARLEATAKTAGATLLVVEAGTPEAIDTAFARAASERATAIVIPPDPLYFTHSVRIARLALQHRLASAFSIGAFVRDGGLVSYGQDYGAEFVRSADYVDKILRGAKPADLPVEQTGRFLTYVNRGTAKALGLTIPQSVLLRADEVIE